MKLLYPTQAEAQAKADAIHDWMVANDPAYAQSAQAGHTLRWSIPFQEAGTWHIFTKERCHGALTAAERAAEKP